MPRLLKSFCFLFAFNSSCIRLVFSLVQEVKTHTKIVKHFTGDRIYGHLHSNTLERCSLKDKDMMWNVSIDRYCLPKRMSCKDSCNEIRYGCSCNALCLVYNNCCEDFVRQCSKILNEGRRKYRTQLHVQSTCVKERVFVVSTCPKNVYTTFDRWRKSINIERLVQTTSVSRRGKIKACLDNANIYYEMMQKAGAVRNTRKSKPVNEVDSKGGLLLEALESLYITDLNSGVYYANLEIFSCHAKSNSVPCLWNISSQFYLKERNGVSRMVTDKVLLIPPIKRNLRPICSDKVISSCTPRSKYYSPSLKQRCSTFRSEVKSNNVWYRNRYCLLCSQGPNSVINLHSDIVKRPYFQMTHVTLENSDTIVLRPRSGVVTSVSGNWINATCKTDDQFRCKVSHCRTGFILRQNGVCSELHVLYIAMRMPTNNLTTAEAESLVNLLQCIVQTDERFDMDDYQPGRLNVFLYDDNVTLFGTDVFLYAPHSLVLRKIIEDITLNIGNALTQMINNDTDNIPRHENHKQITYHSTEWDRNDNQSSVLIHKINNQEGLYIPGPFCSSIKSNSYFKLNCFPETETNTSWQNKISMLENLTCLRNYFDVRDSMLIDTTQESSIQQSATQNSGYPGQCWRFVYIVVTFCLLEFVQDLQ